MPTYIYERIDTGEHIEIVQSMKDDPLAEIDGKPVRRIITSPQLCGVERKTWGYPRVSNQLDEHVKGCKMVRTKLPNGKLSRPKPLIESLRHEKEVAKRNNLVEADLSDS